MRGRKHGRTAGAGSMAGQQVQAVLTHHAACIHELLPGNVGVADLLFQSTCHPLVVAAIKGAHHIVVVLMGVVLLVCVGGEQAAVSSSQQQVAAGSNRQ